MRRVAKKLRVKYFWFRARRGGPRSVESKPRDLRNDRGYRVVMLAGGGSFRLCGADRSLGFAREAEEDVEFDAVGEVDVFEEVEDAAAEAGADFADVAGEGGRSLRL